MENLSSIVISHCHLCAIKITCTIAEVIPPLPFQASHPHTRGTFHLLPDRPVSSNIMFFSQLYTFILPSFLISSFSLTFSWTFMVLAIQAVFCTMSHPKNPFLFKIFTISQFLQYPPILIITNPASFSSKPLMSAIFCILHFYILQETYVVWDCKAMLNIWVCQGSKPFYSSSSLCNSILTAPYTTLAQLSAWSHVH